VSDPAVKMKVKKFVVSNWLLMHLLTEGNEEPAFRIVRGLPEGTSILDVERTAHGVEVFVLHESFPEIPLGEEVPVFEILFETRVP
jgi:hypothetical protein